MPPVNYRVSQPQIVSEAFRGILIRARTTSNSVVRQAARYMLDELAYDPMRFGESRGFRAASELWLRLAFSPPLQV